MQQIQRPSKRVERRGRFTITDLSNEGSIHTEASSTIATAAADVTLTLSDAVVSTSSISTTAIERSFHQNCDKDTNIHTTKAMHSKEKSSKMTRSTSFSDGTRKTAVWTDRKPQSAVFQRNSQDRILHRKETIEEVEISSLSPSHSSGSPCEIMESDKDAIFSCDEVHDRRIQQKGRFKIMETASSSPSASETLYEFDICAGQNANATMAYEWQTETNACVDQNMQQKDFRRSHPCVLMSHGTYKQEQTMSSSFSGSFENVAGHSNRLDGKDHRIVQACEQVELVYPNAIYSYQTHDPRQRPNTANIPPSPSVFTPSVSPNQEIRTPVHQRIKGRSYGSLLHVVEKQRPKQQDDAVTISEGRMGSCATIYSKYSVDPRRLQNDLYNRAGLTWDLPPNITENRLEHCVVHRHAHSNDSRSSISQCGGVRHCVTPPRDVSEGTQPLAPIHRKDVTISDVTEDQRELKQLIGVLQEQLQHLLTYPEYLVEVRLEEERRSKEEHMRQLQRHVDALTHSALSLKDQLNHAKRLDHQRKLEIDQLSEENSVLRRNFGVMNAKYVEERRHSAALELQLNDMIRIANEASQHKDGTWESQQYDGTY